MIVGLPFPQNHDRRTSAVKISVFGLGYLGAVHAAAMASLGHRVVGIDVDAAKVERLQAGQAPFYEPGFQELLDQVLPVGRLTFSTSPAAARKSQVHFMCVGTPQSPDSDRADLSYVQAVTGQLAELLAGTTGRHLLVGKSTVPVGTAEALAGYLAEAAPNVEVLWNPEFLREGFAVEDSLHPDRMVYGVAPGAAGEWATAVLDTVYAPILADGVPRLVMDYATAQLVKVAANSFLATKISFINAMSVLCEASGGDVTALAEAIGLDERIGKRFLRAGLGYGGGCLPKDARALVARADELGVGPTFEFLRHLDAVNTSQRQRVTEMVVRALGGKATGQRVAMLGAAFKPNSDDVRDSPALAVARGLAELGAQVRLYDPVAGPAGLRAAPGVELSASVAEAAAQAQVVVVGTEWDEFKRLDPVELAQVVAARRVVDA
ncbi:MAG: UDP-glucose/GDP-mannose dehydrogenase family protein, partial [Bifidobacteriaceae bacterium]|nr:UDP-glucose/GDP-mannose dehydrogenase family protein [Bifidobacteriaceae bacterium]